MDAMNKNGGVDGILERAKGQQSVVSSDAPE